MAASFRSIVAVRTYSWSPNQHVWVKMGNHNKLHQVPAVFFSTSSSSKSSSSSSSSSKSPAMSQISNLRRMVKPFFLKCHPDVHPSKLAKKVNLAAVQNLNSYLDILQAMASGKHKFPSSSSKDKKEKNEPDIMTIDFVMAESTSRRKVELVLPHEALVRPVNASPASLSQVSHRVYQHSRHELAKLLGMAGLSVPRDFVEQERTWEEEVMSFLHDDDEEDHNNRYKSAGFRSDGYYYHTKEGLQRRPLTAFEKNRDRFVSGIRWDLYEEMYQSALQDLETDYVTHQLIEKNPGYKRSMIARILSRARLDESAFNDDTTETTSSSPKSVSYVEQLIAFRRLSILLHLNFADLHMEDFGYMWETCRIRLTPNRPYNTSSSALNKRRKQGLQTGFAFTLHPDLSVTMQIPMDFGDDELLKELENNVWDFYNFVGDGTEALFPTD